MDLMNRMLNMVVPAGLLLASSFLFPAVWLFRLLHSVLASLFPEDMTRKVVVITGASSGIGEATETRDMKNVAWNVKVEGEPLRLFIETPSRFALDLRHPFIMLLLSQEWRASSRTQRQNQHMAYEYAKKGAFLVLVARREISLRAVAETAMAIGSPDALIVPADVSKPDDCRKFIDETINRFGRLDHLVNNAGISNLCMFEEVTAITNFTFVMDVNFWGSVYPTHFAIPHLKRTGGRIVVNSSSAGWVAMPRMSFYNASKAALINFFETLRSEFGSEIGITIATPGWIESEMSKGKFLTKEGVVEVDQEARDVQVGATPVQNTEECAKAIVDAACRGERYVTVPAWYRVFYMLRVFVPELLDWAFRAMYVTGLGRSGDEPLTKTVLDLTGAKSLMYPSSIQSGEVKTD